MDTPHHYEIFDWSLLSNVPIPELNAQPKVAGRKRIQFTVDATKGLNEDREWKTFWKDGQNGVWMEAHIPTREHFALRFPDFAEFTINADAAENIEITCVPVGQTPPETIGHLLLDQVIPLICSCLGSMVMHMAVVKIGDVGIAFLGVSGQGKSTLTAEFSRTGYAAVSDDTVLISETNGTYHATPNYSGIRLWGDSQESLLGEATYSSASHYNDKRRVADDNLHFTLKSVPLLAMYVLTSPASESDTGIQISRMGFADASKEMLQSKFRLLTDDSQFLKDEFQSVLDVLQHVPCFEIVYPRVYERIGEVRTALLEHALSLDS